MPTLSNDWDSSKDVWKNIALAASFDLFFGLQFVYSCAEAGVASYKTCTFVLPKWASSFKISD